MKKINILTLTLLFLLGFASCQKAEINQNDDQKTHTVTFVAGAPETKTTVSIEGKTAKFAWTSEDVDRIKLYENSTPAKLTRGTLTDGIMTIEAVFTDGVSTGENTYVAVLNSANDLQILYKEAYTEDADILVSKAISSFDEHKSVQLQFKREVAIAKMTLKGLDAGEVVNHITVSSTAGIAGSYGVDGWNSTKTSLDIYSAKALDDQETYSIVANESGEAVVWFTCIPQADATLTVKVKAADGDTYTKEFSKPITLNRGDVTSFGVAMTKDASKTYGYQKISDVSDYTPGDYIILAHVYKEGCPTTGDFAIANDLSLSSQKLLGKEVTNLIDNDVISVSDGASYKLSLSGDRDNIVISNGTNILAYKSSTDFVLDGDNKYWTLSLNDGNGGTFQLLNNSTATADTKRALLFQSYSTSGSNKTASLKFGAYAAGNINNVDYAAIELYKYQEVTPPTPKYSITFAEVTGGTLSASPVKAEAGAEVTLTATPDEGYAFNNDWTVKDADDAKIDVTEGKFTMPAKDVTVSGSFSKVDYTITKATSEGGSFTVKKNGVEVTKAQIGETITLTASAAEGYKFDSWTVTNESTSKTVYVNENTFTMPGANVTVKAKFVELAVVPVYASLEELVKAGAPTTEGTYVTVTLTNDEITGIYTTSKGYRNGIYFKVGTQEVEIYCQNVPESWGIGGYVSGTLTNCAWKLYSSTWELCPADWSELTCAAPCETPDITLDGAVATITCATKGATIRYTLDKTDPTETSDIYSNPVPLTEGKTIKAKAFLTGHKPSEVASKTYSSTGGETTYSYKFTSKAWAATLNEAEANWTSGKDGNSYANSGVQVTTGVSGANATSPIAFTNVSKIVVRYCTNAKAGKGAVTLKVGETTFGTQSISAPSSGGTTEKSFEISRNTPLSGNVNISVTCTTNSIYIIGIDITAN